MMVMLVVVVVNRDRGGGGGGGVDKSRSGGGNGGDCNKGYGAYTEEDGDCGLLLPLLSYILTLFSSPFLPSPFLFFPFLSPLPLACSCCFNPRPK